LVIWNDGRLDFAALQRRLHPSTGRVRQLSLVLPASILAQPPLQLRELLGTAPPAAP
jgi:hypothetical protein